MSRRTSIVKALSEKFKEIDGTGQYNTNLYNNSFPKLKFWDEVQDFPCVYMHPGSETRDYLPGNFTWGMLMVCVKVYVRSEDDAQEQLELLLEDLERCIDANRVLQYDVGSSLETTEILIQSITTDEGLLAPYGVGEINLEVRYALDN
jgi:hypothetical protein